MPTWRDHFAMLARYDLWATERLLHDHVEPLSDADYRRACGLFFGSVHGTLNHLWVAGHGLWYPRFADGISPKRRLDEEAFEDRAALAAALRDGARRWVALIEGWDASRFEGRLDYTTTRGDPQSLPFAAALTHVFNHGTHHRGQVSAALTAMGHAAPEIDLVWMLQAEARGQS